MREPSIHITRSQFISLIEKIGWHLTDREIHKLFSEARKCSLTNRSYLVKDKKNRTKLDKIVASNLGDANLLADIIYSVRIKMRHKGVVKIRQNDSQWISVKELVKPVNDFCQEFNFPVREGYIKFVEMSLQLMTSSTKKPNFSYCANWMLKNMDYVLNTFRSLQELSQAPDPEEIEEIHSLYCSKVVDRSGIIVNYKSNPLEYVNFLYARDEAVKSNVSFEDYIEAQFAALDFCSGIPKVTDLYGDKAKQRLIKYLSQNGYNSKTDISSGFTDWDKFKQ